MEQSDRHEFLYFSQRKDNGLIEFDDPNDVEVRMILPRHSETNDLDKYYLQSMLTGFDGSGDFQAYEILDAFPVLSLTTDVNDKFYKLSIARLQEFALGKIEEDEYIGASIKHLFMQSQIYRKNDNNSLLYECLNRISPIMYNRDSRDTQRLDFSIKLWREATTDYNELLSTVDCCQEDENISYGVE